jgi:hypothetical protein
MCEIASERQIRKHELNAEKVKKQLRRQQRFRKFVEFRFAELLQMWQFADLRFADLWFADPILFCGLKTSANPQMHNFSP